MTHPWWGGQEVDVGSWNDCAESGKPLKKERGEGEGERKKERRMSGWEGGGGRGSCGGRLKTRI